MYNNKAVGMVIITQFSQLEKFFEKTAIWDMKTATN